MPQTDIIETGNPVATNDAGDQSGLISEVRSLEAAHGFARYDYTPAALTADQNDYEPQDYSVIRLSGTAARTITGLASGRYGKILTFLNVGSYNLTFSDQSTSSAASNRIITSDGDDLILKPDQAVTFHYDVTGARWRVVSAPTAVFQPTNVFFPGMPLADTVGLVVDSANSYVYTGCDVNFGNNKVTRYSMLGSALVTNGLSNSYYFYNDTSFADQMADFCLLGTKLYLWVYQLAPTSAWGLLYLEQADASGGMMTISGTAPPDAPCNVATDGTTLYIHEVDTNIVRTYSVSGTTATYVAQITLDDYANRICTDGTNIWYFSTFTGGAATVDNAFYKATMAGATVSYRTLHELTYAAALGMDVDKGYVWALFKSRATPVPSANLSCWLFPIERI